MIKQFQASEYKIESRKESTFHETKVEESKMSATTADGTTTTQESLVQESQIEEILMEEVDGSRTTVSAVEAHKGVLETKDGEVITSDFETFAHSQQTVTGEIFNFFKYLNEWPCFISLYDLF